MYIYTHIYITFTYTFTTYQIPHTNTHTHIYIYIYIHAHVHVHIRTGTIDRNEFIQTAYKNIRIKDYLKTIDQLIANTWATVKDRIENVIETNEGIYIYIYMFLHLLFFWYLLQHKQ